VIALHSATGKLVWHFQFTPHDMHDWDSNQTPILTEISFKGKKRKVICWANRNGFYNVLDRITGELLTGIPFAEQNWATGLDPNGRPIPTSRNEASATGQLISPSFAGGTNWQNPALDQAKGSFFVHATDGAAVFTKSAAPSRRDIEKGPFLSSFGYNPEIPKVVLRALDVGTDAKKWETFSPPIINGLPYSYSRLLATGGGLVFAGSGGYEFALDSETGHVLWRVFVGGDTRAAPISFTVNGKQVIAVSAGHSFFLFGL